MTSELEQAAEIVEQIRMTVIDAAIEAARAEERERCAGICREIRARADAVAHEDYWTFWYWIKCANQILWEIEHPDDNLIPSEIAKEFLR